MMSYLALLGIMATQAIVLPGMRTRAEREQFSEAELHLLHDVINVEVWRRNWLTSHCHHFRSRGSTVSVVRTSEVTTEERFTVLSCVSWKILSTRRWLSTSSRHSWDFIDFRSTKNIMTHSLTEKNTKSEEDLASLDTLKKTVNSWRVWQCRDPSLEKTENTNTRSSGESFLSVNLEIAYNDKISINSSLYLWVCDQLTFNII